MTALAVIDGLAPAVFPAPENIDAMLAKIEADVRAVPIDISTAAGRKAVASLAYKIARSRTHFDEMGKELVSGWKKQAKVIDAERARVWDRLEALQAEVRKPLDEYEAAEAKRIADHQNALQAIIDLGTFGADLPASADVLSALAAFDEIPERDWQEFKQKFGAARSETFARLHALKEAALAREAESAELARLRAVEVERLRREREEQISIAAAAAATKLAEDRAAQEAARIANETAERERRAAQEKTEALARAEKAERDAADAVAKAERDKSDAIEAERKRVSDEAAAVARETERRETDKAHRKAVNSEALKALVAAGLSNADGIKAITAIVRGEVPNIKISY
jgi:hypothetical protein